MISSNGGGGVSQSSGSAQGGIPRTRITNKKELQKFITDQQTLGFGSGAMYSYHMGNQKNAQALNLSSLIVVQPAYNSTVENAINAISSAYNNINSNGQMQAQMQPKRIMNNAQLQQTLMAQAGLSALDRKNNLYSLGATGGKSQPPPSSHGVGNLSNLLQMQSSASKERFQVMDQANSTSGVGNIQDMIQKAKLGNGSPDFALMQSSKDQISGSNSVDKQQEEATLQFLKNQIFSSPPVGGKKVPKQYPTRGEAPKLIHGHNTTSGVSYQQSNSVLPVINNSFGNANSNIMSATSSPMKVGYNSYQNSVIMGDGEGGVFTNKSLSVAARAMGMIHNVNGILQRDEVSPSFQKVQSYLNQDMQNSNFFKGKLIASTNGTSPTKDEISAQLSQKTSVISKIPSFPISTSTDLALSPTPKSKQLKQPNAPPPPGISKYNPYSVNYQFNSCFQVQLNKGEQNQGKTGDPIQQSADFAQITDVLKSNQKSSPERTSKIFRIKNSGVNNLPPPKTPERQVTKHQSLRRNSRQGQSGVEFDDYESDEDKMTNTQEISAKSKGHGHQPSVDTNNGRSQCSTYRKRDHSQLSHHGVGEGKLQPPTSQNITNLLELINVQNAVQLSQGLGVNCFPVQSTINTYSGVFLGDGVLQAPGQPATTTNSGLSMVPPSGSQLKAGKKRHQTLLDESGRISQIKKSTDFSKYMEYQPKHPAISSTHELKQQVQSLREEPQSQSFVINQVLTPGFSQNFTQGKGAKVEKSSLDKMVTLSQAERQQQTIDCQEIVKNHFHERYHNSIIRQQIALKKRQQQNKQAYQNLPSHLQQLQQQQSEMILNVLTDLRKKKKQGIKQGEMGQFRVGNGLNGQGDVVFGSTIGYARGDNLLDYPLVSKPQNNGQNIHLAIEGVGTMIAQQPKKYMMTKQEQFLQQQFFSRIENKSELRGYDESHLPIQVELPQLQQNPENTKSSDSIIRNQCSIILAMITNSTQNGTGGDLQDEGTLNAESLLSQLSEIVHKCRTLLRDNSQNLGTSAKRSQNVSPPPSTVALGGQSVEDLNSVSNMIARKESPLKIIKQVLESRLLEMSNHTMMNSSERKTRDTMKIYEELLNEITIALENIKVAQNPSQPEDQRVGTPRSPHKQSNFIKMNGMTPGVSPKIFGSQQKAKLGNSKSPFISTHKHNQKGAKPKITIYHQPYTHLDQHPVNVAIQKINYIIKLIFKPATIKETSGSLTAQQQFEEAKLSEIHRMSKYFNILIPKRFESKVQLREYIQSKEFLVALKTRINTLLYTAINDQNGFTPQDLAFIQGVSSTVQGQVGVPSFAQPTASSGVAQQLLPVLPQTTNANVQSTAGEAPPSYQVSQQKFFVGRGNNNALVRSVLKQRSWWVQYIAPNNQPVHEDEVVSEVSFIWTQWKKQKIIDYLGKAIDPIAKDSTTGMSIPRALPTTGPRFRIYNKMEQNKQLTNKKGVFINMREYYRKLGQDPFDVLPLTFLIKAGDTSGAEFRRFTENFAEIAQVSKQREALRQEALQQRYKELEAIRKEQNKGRPLPRKQSPGAKRNKYGGNDYYDEADDDEDFEGGRGYNSPSPDDPFEDFEKDEIVKDIKRRYKVPKNVWIVKPGENTNRGNGINVSSSLPEIKSLVSQPGSGGFDGAGEIKEKTFIVQKYIDHPLLIHNRKFDFRCYGLMTSINGHLKGYFYEDCYIRTSCKEFDIQNLDNKYIHLTNDAVQKNSQDYGKYENGNKMSLHDFQKYLKFIGNPSSPNGDQYYANIDVFRDLMPQIRKLVTDSYRAVYRKIDPGRLRNSFELFGYDFMLDEDFKLSLIEVNTNPCLEISCPLLARIIPEVIDNVFRITLDPIFPSPDLGHNRKCAINEIPQELKFTLVFDEDLDRPALDELFGYVQSQNHSGFRPDGTPKLASSQGDGASTAAGSIPEEMIESDAESDLDEGSADEESGGCGINSGRL